MASPTIKTLTTFSGSDLVVTFGNKAIGQLQQIAWAVQRDKAPVFTFGSPDARSFSRGKRGIAGNMVFAVFDHDSLIAAIQTMWKDIAPSAMFTAAANNKLAMNEDFSNALDMVKWNATVTAAQQGTLNDDSLRLNGDERAGFGFSFGSDYAGTYTNRISAQVSDGSNNSATLNDQDLLPENWDRSGDPIYVPAGFAPMRGENIVYADQLPPFDITMTFASEYGHTAFQKIYDVEILNDNSGASIDTVVMARQCTWIARSMGALTRGVYTRDESGNLRGVLPTSYNQTVREI